MDKQTEFKIYQTRDYSKFKKLLGNRDVSPSRLTSIKESIIRIGYQPAPMIVNEKLEVIDGQGRLAACEALSLPVYYVIKKGLTVDDCISMNMKMENWKTADYINCYADRGFPAYVKLREDLKKFRGLDWTHLLTIKGRGSGAFAKEALTNGRFQYISLNYEESECARWVLAIIPHIVESGLHKRTATEILIRLFRYKMIDQTRMLDSFTKYGAKFGANAPRARDTLQFINEIYNYNRVKTVYFADAYRKEAEKASSKSGEKSLSKNSKSKEDASQYSRP